MSQHFALAASGASGGVDTALAIAAELRRRFADCRITLCGPGGAWDRKQAQASGCEFFAYEAAPDAGGWHALRSLALHWKGQRTIGQFLRGQAVSLVVAANDFPLARAAARRGIPLVLVETESVPSRAARSFAPSAELICGAFPEVRRAIDARGPLRITGVPLRSDFSRARQLEYRQVAMQEGRVSRTALGRGHRLPSLRPPRVLVLGGGRDGHFLNRFIPRALYKVGRARRGWQIVHQAGRRDLEITRDLYRKLAVPAIVVPYVADLPRTLARTDLVMGRSGGATLAALAAAAVPAILVPHAQADDDHQRRNADLLAAEGAALVADPRDVEGRFDDHLAGVLTPILAHRSGLREMSARMARRARPDAAWQVAEMIGELLASRSARQAGA